MTKKKLFIRIVVLIILLALMMPSFIMRVKNEADNKDVLFALQLNNATMTLSDDELLKSTAELKNMGVNQAIIAEESLNSLINGGYVSAIKYNVMCHKYDDETEAIIKNIGKNDKIHNDSYVLITKRNEWKEFLNKWITSKYTENEYTKTTSPSDADVYVIYEGVSDAWHIPVGFDEEKLRYAKENGFQIVLSMMLDAYTNTDYIKNIESIIDEYDVGFINLKKTYKDQNTNKNAKKNYKAFCELIKNKNLYLILTEEQTQLSNQKPIGYAELIESAQGRVIRGYETIDVDSKNTGATIYDKRYSQIFNSVVDRNIRFVAINQLVNGTDTIGEKSEKTNLSTKMAIEKLNSIGYNTASYDKVYKNYTPNRTLTSAAALAVMIIMGLMILEWLTGKELKKLEFLCIAGCVLGFIFTYVAPEGIVLLYPTLFAIVMPCFAITAMMVFAKNMHKRFSSFVFVVLLTAFSLAVLLLCALVQTSLLSGLDYYLNSLIFRGIKISLIVPILYSAVAYGIIFSESDEKYARRILKILNSEIKVMWVLIAGVVGAAAVIYLIRSGNVQKISGIESLMRNTVTEIMPARPRTKEFLIGWPCLVMFLYYIKNTNLTVIKWCFAVGASILFASVTNSFCHVFTSAGVIYSRVINGLIIGSLVSLIFIAANFVIVRIVKKLFREGK